MSSILVAGGERDPNLACLIRAANEQAIEVLPLLVGPRYNPSVTWEIGSSDLRVNGQRGGVAAAFLRRDVFHAGGPDAGYRASAWHAAVQGWLAVRQNVRLFNRGCLDRHFNKLHMLSMAKGANLPVPGTSVTNEVSSIRNSPLRSDRIAKPAAGGGFCYRMDDLPGALELRDGVAASPAIVQPLVEGPDLRIYGIGEKRFGFRIDSDAVDYRNASRRRIMQVDRLPANTLEGLRRLTDEMGLDFWAADFKIPRASGNPVFLEVNSNPMFSAFDSVAGGAISAAILNYLLTVES